MKKFDYHQYVENRSEKWRKMCLDSAKVLEKYGAPVTLADPPEGVICDICHHDINENEDVYVPNGGNSEYAICKTCAKDIV